MGFVFDNTEDDKILDRMLSMADDIDSCGGFITDKYKVADLIKEVADNLPSEYGVTNEC